MEKRIGFGPRLGAALIDAVLVWILSSILGGVLGTLFGGILGMTGSEEPGAQIGGGMVGGILGAMVGMTVVALLYFLMEGFLGWTLGKRILGLQIGTEDGKKAPTSTLLKRWAIKNSSFLLSIVGYITGVTLFSSVLSPIAALAIFIGCFFVLGEARQALHDKLAKTAVFRIQDLS